MARQNHPLMSYFPAGTVHGDEIHHPCPFCGKRETGELTFVGEDRLMWFEVGVFCRQCEADGVIDGSNSPGFHPYSSLANLLGDSWTLEDQEDYLDSSDSVEIVVSDVERATLDEEKMTLPLLVQAAHKQVDRDYWHDLGLSDETIDLFQLGWGRHIDYHFPASHLIPFQPTVVFEDVKTPPDRWCIEMRRPRQKPKSVRDIQVNPKFHVWFVAEDREDKSVMFVEGPKDLLSAYEMGYRNILCVFGSHVTAEMVLMVARNGFSHIIGAGDHDEAGQKFNNRLSELASQHAWGEYPIHKFQHVIHNKDAQKGWDLSDTLMAGDVLQLSDSEILRVDHDTVPLDVVRGEGPRSMGKAIRTFLDTYENGIKPGQGRALVVSTVPGSGKTTTMVKRVLPDHIKRLTAKRRQEYQELIDRRDHLYEETTNRAHLHTDEDLEQYRGAYASVVNRIENFNWGVVAWVSMFKDSWDDIRATGANMDDWYNFEGRNEDNCDNFDTVTQLGANNHDIGRFCAMCPFRQTCGYFKQEEGLRQKPVGFFRHQQLHGQQMRGSYKLIVIDEDPTGVSEKFIRAYPNDLRPFFPTWTDHLDLLAPREKLESLFEAFIRSMRHFPDEELDGHALVEHIKTEYGFDPLAMAGSIDKTYVEDHYQPSYTPGDEEIKPRVAPTLFNLLQQWSQRPDDSPPLRLVNGALHLYEMSQVDWISYRKPVVVLDATARKSLLPIQLKGRQMQYYEPRIELQADVTQVVGANWGKGRANRASSLYWSAKEKSKIIDDIPEVDLSQSSNAYLSKLTKLVDALAKREKDLLVITYKNLREILEDACGHLENVQFGHYGAIRGTNRWAHMSATLLLGTPRVPYETALRQAEGWMWMAQKQEKAGQLVLERKEEVVPGTSISLDYPVVGPAGSFVRNFVNEIEWSEMTQAVTRTRPFSPQVNRQNLYIGAARPLPLFNTTPHHILRIHDVVGLYNKNQLDELIGRIKINIAQGKSPTRRLSTRSIQRIYQLPTQQDAQKMLQEALDEVEKTTTSSVSKG